MSNHNLIEGVMEPKASYSKWLMKKISIGKHTNTYSNYLAIREFILRVMDQENQDASLYWQEELAGFEYIFDASPLIIERLRHHCYHLTGIRDYEYRAHHQGKAQGSFKAKLEALKEADPEGKLLVGESEALGGFGYQIGEYLINLDTLKFYEVLLGLNKAGMLSSSLRRAGKRSVVLEIGAGWGGFAYQFKKLFPQTTYVIVDLPGTLLFSGTYLKTLFPASRFLLVEESQSLNKALFEQYDFVLIPHIVWKETPVSDLDLAINMVSFQEMTSQQVDEYAAKLAESKCPLLYSLNRDVSSHNPELTSVSGILSKYYCLDKVHILDVAYTELKPPFTNCKGKAPQSFWKKIKASLSAKKRKKMREQSLKQREKERFSYQHLAGSLKV